MLLFGLGALLVGAALGSSIKTVILPRAVPSKIARWVFLSVRSAFEVRIGRGATYERRDALFAAYGPTSLLALLAVWVLIILVGYTAIFVALGHPFFEAFQLSGSAVVTLGFAPPRDVGTTLAVVSEAFLGLIELALLITYLPTLYTAFQRREAQVTMLEVRAGSPPSGVEMLLRFARLGRIDHLSEEVWEQWEVWFVDLEETHSSLPALNFFRSPQPHRSWITAAGAVLDGAALYASVVDIDHDSHADLCLRAGYLCLRQIAGSFNLAYTAEPRRGDPISIARREFDDAVDQLQGGGLPVKADREAAWADFSGWRVNYDDVLLALAALVAAPYAPWSSDRGAVRRRGAVRALIGR